MNKKQAGIIVTLLALIVCAGILAAKVNGPLEVTNSEFTSEGSLLTLDDDDAAETSANYFATALEQKEQRDAMALSNLRAMAEDKNLDEAQRTAASESYAQMVEAQKNEQTIMQHLKGKGFEDVICTIENDYTKARVIIKYPHSELTDTDGKVIKDVVYSVAKISNVEVELK
ncbi:SpoIIIAH-like family protein [Clostridium thermarum]|uniref:SpoIIIAH-like family protein n=1 Tax=Clostridium thermarum TaxID=1716543 RepID=UPI0013D7313F|nr:SpoIIIAH-like family protein [Clostridium thermarum]